MRSWNWTSAALRVGVLVLVDMASTALVHNPAPTFVDLIAALPVVLLLNAVPGYVYVVLIRTWTGTWVAGAAIVTVQMTLVAHLSALSTTSSTAGVGLVALPVLLLPPVLGVWAWERRSAALRQPPQTDPLCG